MKYNLIGDSDCPMLEILLDRGETVNVERGSMVFMNNVELEGKLNSNSGIFGAIGRTLTSGESLFITKATGQFDDARLGIAPPLSGEIKILKVDENHQYRMNTSAFLACDTTVKYFMKRQKLSVALFGKSGGLFVAETSGYGDLVVNSYGSIIEIEVTPEKPLTVDNDHVVVWDASLDFSVGIASGMLGFKTGEGVVNKFKGHGKVWVQTRNISSLANALIPFLPINTGREG